MRNEIVEANRIGTIILGIFLLTIMGYSAWFFIELVYECHMQIPLWYKVFFILGVTFTAFVLTGGISPKNKWKVVLPVLLITCLIVFFIPLKVGFSETAEVNVVLMGVRVSDELKVDYIIPIDNKTHRTSKTYESKPGWKFIILELGVVNNVDQIREYSNCWFETKEGVIHSPYKIEDTGSLASWEGTGSYSMSPVELKPDEVIITTIAAQVPSNEDVSNLYFVYNIRGKDLTYSEFGRIKVSR